MKQEYQSAYRKLHADQAFRDRLIHTLEGHDEPRRVRPRWLVPAALAACLIVLFGLGVPTLQRVLQPIESTSSVPSSNEGAILGSDGLYRDSQIKNILCLCTDDNGDGNALMLLSIDHRNGGLKLSSFLPSLKVKAADNTEQILSALFQKEENGDEAVSLIQQNFGLAVDGYIWMDSSAVEVAIDAMGGVTLELSEEEARYFALSSSLEISLGGGFAAGEYTLTGPQALFFGRLHIGSDYDRMLRQQKVAEAILKQIWEDSSSASELLEALIPKVRTNLNLPTVLDILSSMDTFPGNFFSTHDVPDHDPDDLSGGESSDLRTLSQELIAFVYGSAVQQSGVVRGEDGLYRDTQVTNLLLWVGAKDDTADCVMLISLDSADEAVRLVNFVPELAVQVPISGEQPIGKVGMEAGSGSLLRTAVEESFGVAIDGYIRVDYEQAVQVINESGGVPLLHPLETEPLLPSTSQHYFVDPQAPDFSLLTGQEVFEYLDLWEEAGTSTNLDLMMKQEEVLGALLHQMRQLDTEKRRSLTNLIDTDLTDAQLTVFFESIPSGLDSEQDRTIEMDVHRIPMNFTGQAADSDILYADLSACARGLAEFLYDDLPEEQQPNVVDGISPTVGNSNANLANGGIAVDGEDGSIYYINFADNNRIYRWDAQHNTQTALTDGPCLYLNIFHGDLYYINMSDGGIYCLPSKWNLTIPISLDDQPHSDLIVTDAYLYYMRGGEIYQRETRPVTDGSNLGAEAQLPRVDGDLLGLQWGDGKLYYFVRTEATGPDGSQKIAMCHDDTLDCLFSNGTEEDQPYVLDGSTLYYAASGAIHRITADGTDATLFDVSDLVTSQMAEQPDGTILNLPAVSPSVEALWVQGDTMYLSTNSQLYCVDLKALSLQTEKKASIQVLPAAGSIWNLCLTGDYLYYTGDGGFSDTSGYPWQTWRISISGTPVVESNLLPSSPSTEWAP